MNPGTMGVSRRRNCGLRSMEMQIDLCRIDAYMGRSLHLCWDNSASPLLHLPIPRTSDFYFTVQVPEINTIVKHTLRHNQRLFSQYVNILHSICHNKIDIGIPQPLSQCHHTQHKTHVSPTVVAEQETCVSHPHSHSYYPKPHSNILTHNQAVVRP